MQAFSSPNAPKPAGAYTPALRVGDLVFVSGQGPAAPDGKVISGTIEEETRLTLQNVKTLLEAAGARMDQVVKCGCFLADIEDFPRFNAVYREFFKEPLPCRTTVQAGLRGIKVEIDAIAFVGRA
jgi:2-iminobutanoate/2-iminopropanoate deaminase